MRDLLLTVLLLVALARGVALLHSLPSTQSSLKNPRTFSTPTRRFSSDSNLSDEEKENLDNRYNKLIGTFIQCSFSGFGDIDGMTCNIELQKDFAVKFSGGLDTPKPGFWRALKLENGKEAIEATQPVFPEYMFYFDLWEPNLVWKGTLDLVNMKVTDGEVVANKKRWGLFPYQDSIATFKGDILPISDKPKMRIPTFAAQRFVPPNDFEDPRDMKRYTELFEPEYVDWWFDNEDAMARGSQSPLRPKSFFSPPGMSGSTAYIEDEGRSKRENDLTAVRQSGKGKKGKGSKGMSKGKE